MAELLLELLSEEIPARMQARAAEDLKRIVTDGLNEAGLSFESANAFATPRRLALAVDGIPAKQPDTTEERRGPRADAPAEAVKGFKGSLPKGARVETRKTEKGAFYFAVIENRGRPIEDILHEIVYRTIWNLPWPKSMRWGDTDLRWIRPIQNLLVIINGRVPHLPIPMLSPSKSVSETLRGDASINPSDQTQGHRFMAPERFEVTNFADYRAKLKKAYVILDPAERRAVIEREAARLARAEGLLLKPDPALVAENAGMVEWPVVLMGRIDPEFMDLPPEVLTTAFGHHQKYFALTDKDGKLAPRFLVVANLEAPDGGKGIVAGNERVLKARLADAKFFWDQDRKRRLDRRVDDLTEIAFYEGLGSLRDKVRRIEVLAPQLALRVPDADPELCKQAARLCKADLTTEMVSEFPELQGVIGRYYALHEGKHRQVADAIAEHYAPQGPSDRCPTAPVSVALALADKIDSLVGFFGVGQTPTGSKDPLALRRAAVGMMRLILENKLRLPLSKYLGQANHLYAEAHDAVPWDATPASVVAFIADRLKVHLKEQGVRHDLISGVFAARAEDDLVRLLAKVGALEKFLSSEDGEHLLIAYKRAANIVRIEEKRDGKPYDGAPLSNRFQQDEENDLHASLTAAATASSVMLQNEEFSAAMSELAKLRRPVDRFFDEVTVNCEDGKLRENRLKLLSQIRATMNTVADFSRIEG